MPLTDGGRLCHKGVDPHFRKRQASSSADFVRTGFFEGRLPPRELDGPFKGFLPRLNPRRIVFLRAPDILVP